MTTELRLGVFALLTLLATNCGVEVGNPHPKPGTGALTLALADAPSDDARHVYFNIVGMRVVPELEGGQYGEPVAVALANAGKVDALALSGGKSLELSTAQAIAPGSYVGVILDLDPTTPATIVGLDDQERPLSFRDAGRGIFVAQGFEAVIGEELKITLHVDLRRSIKQLEDGGERHFEFGPVAHMVRQGDDAGIAGTGVAGDFTSVCAFLRRSATFNGGQFGRIPRHDGGPRGGGGHDGPIGSEGPAGHEGPHHEGPPPPGFDGGKPHLDARLPPSFAPGGDVKPDGDATCVNAFATASVTGGAYAFSHL